MLSSNETPSVTATKHLLVFFEREKGLAMSRASLKGISDLEEESFQGQRCRMRGQSATAIKQDKTSRNAVL